MWPVYRAFGMPVRVQVFDRKVARPLFQFPRIDGCYVRRLDSGARPALRMLYQGGPDP